MNTNRSQPWEDFSYGSAAPTTTARSARAARFAAASVVPATHSDKAQSHAAHRAEHRTAPRTAPRTASRTERDELQAFAQTLEQLYGY
jgi:hypothetical protein